MAKSTTHAVIIGINEYTNASIAPLRYARADAEAMRKVLADPAYGKVPQENIICLLDEQATREEISHTIGTELPRRAAKEDLVVVYFAGHGAVEPDVRSGGSDGLGKFLLPSDSKADRIFSTAISMNDIRTWFGRIDAERIVFLIDSCYSGAAGGRTYPKPGDAHRAALLDDAFLEDLSGKGRIVISACGVNQLALEGGTLSGGPLSNGLFTHFLVEGLRGKADPQQSGQVTVSKLYQYLSSEVPRISRQRGSVMEPVMKGELSGQIVLSRYETAAQRKQREEERELQQLAEQAQQTLREEDWPTAKKHLLSILKIRPGHAKAHEGLQKLEQREQAERRRREAERKKRQKVLLDLRRQGKLGSADYERATQLLRRSEGLTSLESEQRLLLLDLTDRRISVETFLDSMELLEEGPPAESGGSAPQKPEKQQPEKTLPAEPQETTKEFAAMKPPVEKPEPAQPPRVIREELAETEPQLVRTEAEPSNDDKTSNDGKKWASYRWIGAAVAVVVIGILAYAFWPGPTSPLDTRSKSDSETGSGIKDSVAATQKPEGKIQRPTGKALSETMYNGLFARDKFARIPAGSFRMGSTDENAGSDEQPPHTVRISRDFYLGKYEVTQKQWQVVMGTTISQQRDKANKDWPLRGEGANYPMYYVSWEEVKDFVGKLNDGAGREIFRLPSEAEWEYACRAATSTAYNTGDKLLASEANFGRTESTKAVGSFAANAWGLYDMHGNVWEWCQDRYGSDYYQQFASKTAVDPQGPAGGSRRVVRGGSWSDDAQYCRSAYRPDLDPGYRSYSVGFRLVFVP